MAHTPGARILLPSDQDISDYTECEALYDAENSVAFIASGAALDFQVSLSVSIVFKMTEDSSSYLKKKKNLENTNARVNLASLRHDI